MWDPDNETAPSSHEASEPAPDSPVSDEEVLGDEENQADALADSPEEVPTVQPPAEAPITTQQSVTPTPETIPETIEKETVQDISYWFFWRFVSQNWHRQKPYHTFDTS